MLDTKTRHLSFHDLRDVARRRSVSFIRVARHISITTEEGGVENLSNQINAMGFGSYQMQVFILCAGFVMAETVFLEMTSGLQTAISLEFGILSHVNKAMPMMCVFIGTAGGTLASGPFGNEYGRRMPILIGYLGLIASAILMFLLPTLTILYILLVVIGFFAGFGLPTSLITLSESLPDANRGIMNGALGIAYCLGELWSAFGLWLFMPDLTIGPWRFLVLWAGIPAVCLLIFGFVSPVTKYETPHFLGIRGRNGELVEAINLIAELNNRPEYALALGDMLIVENHAALNLTDAMSYLSSWPTVMFIVVHCLMFFTKDLDNRGMGVFWPVVFEETHPKMSSSLELILTAVCGIPGVGIAMGAMYSLPRRVVLSGSAVICATATLMLKGVLDGQPYAFIGVLIFKLFFPTMQMITMLIPSEVFPTQVRVWAWSFIAFTGKIATIISPILVNMSEVVFLQVCSGLAFAVAVFVWVLPETRNRKLNCIDGDGKIDKPRYGSMDSTSNESSYSGSRRNSW